MKIAPCPFFIVIDPGTITVLNCYRWIRNEKERQGLSKKLTSEDPLVADLMLLIRFPCMPAKFIAEEVEPSNVISDKDLVALFCHIATRDSGSENPRYSSSVFRDWLFCFALLVDSLVLIVYRFRNRLLRFCAEPRKPA